MKTENSGLTITINGVTPDNINRIGAVLASIANKYETTATTEVKVPKNAKARNAQKAKEETFGDDEASFGDASASEDESTETDDSFGDNASDTDSEGDDSFDDTAEEETVAEADKTKMKNFLKTAAAKGPKFATKIGNILKKYGNGNINTVSFSNYKKIYAEVKAL